jgi:YbbR domain-containing protein
MRTEASRTQGAQPPPESDAGETKVEDTSKVTEDAAEVADPNANNGAAPVAAIDPNDTESLDALIALSPPATKPAPARPTGSIERNARRLIESLSLDERLGRIILSIVLAVLLWFYVTNLDNPAQVTQFNGLTLEVRGLDKSLKIINTLPTIDVTVQAPQNIMSTLRQTDIHPYVDLHGLDAGVHEVPIVLDLTALPDHSTMTFSVAPQNVQVQLELEASRVFPVTVLVTGTPAQNYGAEPAQVNPQQVTVSGPESAVSRIEQVVVSEDVSGTASTQSGYKSPVALDNAGKLVSGVTADPPTVQVVVPIQLYVATKLVPVHVPIIGNPAPGYSASQIDVNPKVVTICCAPSDVLVHISSIDTNPVSIAGATSTVVTTTQLILPSGVQLYPGQPATISVTVQISTFETTWQLSVPPTVENVAPGLTAIPSPSSITLTLSGTLAQFQSLKPSDILATVDAKGLDPGTYELDPQVTVPQGVKLVGIDPPKVALTLIAPTPTPTHTPTLAPTLAPTATPHLVVPSSPTPLPTATHTLAPVPTTPPTPQPTAPPTSTPSPVQSPTHTQPPASPTPTAATGAASAGSPALPSPTHLSLEPATTPTP